MSLRLTKMLLADHQISAPLEKKMIGTHNRGTAISITVQEPLCNTKEDRQISAAIISALSVINFRTLGEYVHWRFLILAMCSVN